MGDIIVMLLLAVAAGLAIRKMIRDRKAGKSSCGCECGSCPSKGTCGGKQK